MRPIQHAHTSKKQIIHKGSVGGGLMSSAENVVRLDTWCGFASLNNLKRQIILRSNMKRSNFLSQHAEQHASRQATTLAILG
ncbi:hypothetical protein AB3S75_043807 [Citrus x aurantiifolia]